MKDQSHLPSLSRRRLLSLAAVGVAGGLLEACAPAAPQAATPSPAAAVPTSAPSRPATVVNIFGLHSLTGPSGAVGLVAQEGSDLAIKQINEAGGFQDAQGNRYTLKMPRNDMGNDRTEAIALVRKAADDPTVTCVLGPTNSLGFLAVLPVLPQVKVPLIGTGTLAPAAQWNEWGYRVNGVLATGVPLELKAVAAATNMKRLAILYDLTQDTQVAIPKIAKEQAGSIGYTIVAEQSFRSGDQDFSTQLTAIKASQPDVLLLAAQAADAPRIIIQVRGQGMTVPMIGASDLITGSYWDASNGLAVGMYTWVGPDFSSPTPELSKFIDEYKKEFAGKAPASESTYGWVGVHTVVAAVKQAGTATDREKFRQALANIDLTTPLGRVTFKNPPNGENLNPTVTIVRLTGRATFVKVG